MLGELEKGCGYAGDPESQEQFASVLWTEGRFLFSINSSSMTHVLQFEQERKDEEE